MFLEENTDLQLNRLKGQVTYTAGYKYWLNNLFERLHRLFVWSGLGPVPQKEVETPLLLFGHCGISKLPREKELTAFRGTFFGVTKYVDEWKNYTVSCPIYSGTRTIGKDVAVIDNNTLRNPALPLCSHYASLLAHCETTMLNTFINQRDAGGVPIVSTQKQVESFKAYHADLINGEFGTVRDDGLLGVEFGGTNRLTPASPVELMEVRSRLLKNFYADIGISTGWEKRNNSVVAEFESDNDAYLLLNINDMFENRKRGADEVNRIFGTSWTVEKSEELKKMEERGEDYVDRESDLQISENE